MPAPDSFARRQFPGAAVDTTISSGINNSAAAVDLDSTAGWPDGSYTGAILCELYSTSTGVTAEKVWATARAGNTLAIVRAADGTAATSHAAGTGIRPVAGAVDADEANRAVNETIGQVDAAGQLLVSDGANSFTKLDAKTSGRILVGDGATVASVAVSGDVTLASTGAVTIGNDKVDSQHIAAGAVDLEHMSANSVDSDQYVDGSIDTEHLADEAVTTAKIADGDVTEDKLASSVAGDGLSGGAGTALSVTVDDSTIEIDGGTVQVKDGGIDTDQLADGAVTASKLDGSIARFGGATWIPVWKLGGGSGTAITVGNGVSEGYMNWSGDLFWFVVRLKIGSTTNLNGGTGQLVASLDTNSFFANSSFAPDLVAVGQIRDTSENSAEVVYGRVEASQPSYLTFRQSNLAMVTHAQPYSLANGDTISVHGVAVVSWP